jgi:hypothetical protein
MYVYGSCLEENQERNITQLKGSLSSQEVSSERHDAASHKDVPIRFDYIRQANTEGYVA